MRTIQLLSLMTAAAILGCRDTTPPPPRAPVPPAWNDSAVRRHDPPKPLPHQGADLSLKPYHDDPLLVDAPPETTAYLDAYARVGRPRITVFVNRTLEGRLITAVAAPAANTRPAAAVPADNTDPYLAVGDYDEVSAKAIDYVMMENILADWLSANNRVELIAPMMVRRKLTDEQVRDLQSGRQRTLADIAQDMEVDVLVQVQARPTRQTSQGLEIRVIAEAINVRGGQSIARAAVDVPPPLEKTRLNAYTRFLARKLMDGMTGSWQAMVAATPAGAVPPAPAPPPAVPPATRPY